jgi:membrane-bound serine protease (ClpP class)
MIRVRCVGPAILVVAALAVWVALDCEVRAQQPAVAPASSPGQFFPIVEPITHETIARVRAATRQLVDRNATAAEGSRPILIFEFSGGDVAPGTSEFGVCYDLATLISRELAGAKLTVAYVSQPLSGYAVLPAIACTEIVMSSTASLGPITADGKSVDPVVKEGVKLLAMRKTRDPDLLLGMLDRDADLRVVKTSDKAVYYVMPENMPQFLETHHVVGEPRPAWDGGQRGILTAARARDDGFCKRTADSRAEVTALYQLSGQSSVDDPTLGHAIRPAWVKLEGPLDTMMVGYVSRLVDQARQEKVNLLFVQINSNGGSDAAADGLADLLSGIKDMKTVAYVDDQATGLASLLPLACRDIVLKKSARIGDIRQMVVGRGGRLEALSEVQIASISKKAALLARLCGHPEAVGQAMVDPDLVLVEALDAKTGAMRLVSQSEADAEPARFQVTKTRKESGGVLTLTSEDIGAFGLGQAVADDEELKALYSLRGKEIRVEGPGWVDSLVTILTDPYVSWLLLFVGGFMLVIELKLPGIGLPAITSALAFLLFFWSHYLSGTADQLEIMLFLVGLVCLALELFVFPGFGIFGMSGILLMLTSIVMASHTFIWPTHDYEYRELGYTLLQLMGMLVAVGAAGAVLARYLPSLPLFNRLVLRPEPWVGVVSEDSTGRPTTDGPESLGFLIGEMGRTTTPLRPSGKARFGNSQIDVVCNIFVEPDSLVEVTDVQGSRVIVRKVGS